MSRHLRLLEVRSLASEGCGIGKTEACDLRDAAGGQQSPGHVKSRCRHHGLKTLSALLPSFHRQLPYSIHLTVVVLWDSSALPGDGSWSEGTTEQHGPVEDPGPLVWWNRIQHVLGEEPRLHKPAPQLLCILLHGEDPSSVLL